MSVTFDFKFFGDGELLQSFEGISAEEVLKHAGVGESIPEGEQFEKARERESDFRDAVLRGESAVLKEGFLDAHPDVDAEEMKFFQLLGLALEVETHAIARPTA